MLRLRRLTALVATLMVGIAACSGDSPTTPTPALAPATPTPLLGSLPIVGSLLGGYVKCTPLPEAYSATTIGPDGGVLQAGKHTLIVPPGALTQPVLISMRAPSDTINSVVFGPEGLTFQQGHSPALTLDYSNCPNPLLVKKRIVYSSNNLLQILEVLLSLDLQQSSKVSAPIKHFSRYAVHY